MKRHKAGGKNAEIKTGKFIAVPLFSSFVFFLSFSSLSFSFLPSFFFFLFSCLCVGKSSSSRRRSSDSFVLGASDEYLELGEASPGAVLEHPPTVMETTLDNLPEDAVPAEQPQPQNAEPAGDVGGASSTRSTRSTHSRGSPAPDDPGDPDDHDDTSSTSEAAGPPPDPDVCFPWLPMQAYQNRLYEAVSLFVIFVSVANFCIETLPQYDKYDGKRDSPFFYIESVCIGVFTIEYIWRFVRTHKQQQQ